MATSESALEANERNDRLWRKSYEDGGAEIDAFKQSANRSHTVKEKNISEPERIASGVGGGALAHVISLAARHQAKRTNDEDDGADVETEEHRPGNGDLAERSNDRDDNHCCKEQPEVEVADVLHRAVRSTT